MPPRCEVCDRECMDDSGGGLVPFRDYEPLPEGTTGHPRGLMWFCRRHIGRARKLTHVDSTDAVALIRRRWWFRLFS